MVPKGKNAMSSSDVYAGSQEDETSDQTAALSFN